VFEPTAVQIDAYGVFDQAEALLRSGNSASRQLACYAQGMAQGADSPRCVQRVVDHLLQETRG
jgi:hypothetical protein